MRTLGRLDRQGAPFCHTQDQEDRLRRPIHAIRALVSHLEQDPAIELCHTPQTGILCFRINTPDVDPENLDRLQEYVFECVSSTGKRGISLSHLDGRTVLRLVAVNTSATFEALLETVETAVSLAHQFPPHNGT